LAVEGNVLDHELSPLASFFGRRRVDETVHVVRPVEVQTWTSDVPIREVGGIGPNDETLALGYPRG
jgi:hypothetical protein